MNTVYSVDCILYNVKCTLCTVYTVYQISPTIQNLDLMQYVWEFYPTASALPLLCPALQSDHDWQVWATEAALHPASFLFILLLLFAELQIKPK